MNAQRTTRPRHISRRQWQNWQWQCAHAATTPQDLEQWIPLTEDAVHDIGRVIQTYRMRITPYIMNLMQEACPIQKQFIPCSEEIQDTRGCDDPKQEGSTLPFDYLFRIHDDRMVLCVTNQCSSLCRYCFRKHRLGTKDCILSQDQLCTAFDYIETQRDIRDVLITGGDPLLLSDDVLEYILRSLRNIDHVDIIRIGTRVISTLPQRITSALAKRIKKYHPVWISTQFNHPCEITAEVIEACDILLSRGIPLNNQSVLLKGINDDPEVMHTLLHNLIKLRIRPYYLYHSNFVCGTMHFQTPITTGQHIMKMLEARLSGFALPRYVLSTHRGKILLNADNIIRDDDFHLCLRSNDDSEVCIDTMQKKIIFDSAGVDATCIM